MKSVGTYYVVSEDILPTAFGKVALHHVCNFIAMFGSFAI